MGVGVVFSADMTMVWRLDRAAVHSQNVFLKMTRSGTF